MVTTRTIRLADGRQEIVRLLSVTDAEEGANSEPLAFEKSIVWLEDIQHLGYVRVVEVRCARSRRGRLRLNSGQRVVGYSKLFPSAPRDPETACFTRRLFYLKPADGDSHCPPPRNAVDPKTVLPGVLGQKPVP